MVELLFFISGAVSFACIYWIYRLVSDAPQLQLKNSERDRVDGVFDADGSISRDASQTTVSQPVPKKEEDHQIEVSRGGIDAGDLELIKDVLHSSAQQSQAMLVSLDRSEAERSKLMKFLSQSKGAKAAAFRSLSEMPGDIAEHPEDDIYVGLSGQNKKLKERLYQLERENLYLKESLQGDIEERRGVMDETTHPKKQ